MNPLFRNSCDPIRFDQVTVEMVKEAAETVVRMCLDRKKQVLAAPDDSVYGRLMQADYIDGELDFVLSPLYLFKDVHPDRAIRDACHQAVEDLLNFDTKMDCDEELYRALCAFSETGPDLSPPQARYLKLRLEHFERNGLKLDKPLRDQLTALDEELTQVELLFQKNIAESDATLVFDEARLQDLPADYLAERRRADGRIEVTTKYPDYQPFMRYVSDEAARKELYTAYNHRAREENLPLLRRMLLLRNKRSALLGFKTYAAYKLEDKMAGDADTVWSFIRDLQTRVLDKAKQDCELLCKTLGVAAVPAWSKLYATTRYMAQAFDLSDEMVKPYFPLEGTLNGLFDVCAGLFSIRIERADLPVWHDDVWTYNVFEGDTLLGRFYLDMYPREAKYSHAACFCVQSGRQTDTGYQQPAVALVCNFARPTADKPCLLSHGDVETLFHEFGHLLHQILTRSPFYRLSGTAVARDFVEMPSQMMECWAWEKDVLRTFAKHYKTGEPIPSSLVDKMAAVRMLNSGIDVQQQLLYGALDMTYHDGYTPGEDPEETSRIYRDLCKEYVLFDTVDTAAMQAAFGHLVGYSAGYYGYLWSKVYALDMYSAFEQGGIRSAEVGKRFRDIVLASGDTEDPMVLIERFLGRKPRLDAFLASIGV